MPMPTCPLREQRATIVKVMNVPPSKHAGGFPVAMQEARHALGGAAERFAQILQFALQETQELLGRERQLARRVSDRIDRRRIDEAIADRNGNQIARAQAVRGGQTRMERDAVVDVDEMHPELDRIRLEDGYHVDAGRLA